MASTSVDKKAAKTAGRVLLADYATPTHYDLKLVPDLEAFIFDGLVQIEMTTSDTMSEKESKKITLHANELLFRSAQFTTVSDDGGATTPPEVVKAEEVSCRCVVDFVFVVNSGSLPLVVLFD